MNKAVLALSLVMAVTVLSTIGAATVQFVTAAEESRRIHHNTSDDNTNSNNSQFAAFSFSTARVIIM